MLTNLRQLFHYNTRILLSNSYWLLIIPVVASQLILFWHMAIASMVNASMIANSFELVIPLLAAFLCAHVVAPEHQNRVDELTFARPVPFSRTIVLRLLSMYVIVAGLAALMLLVYEKGIKSEFEVVPTLLAGVPSALFLSLLALGFASAWRSAAVGIGVAVACWAVDLAWGSFVNPVFSLHGYAISLAAEGTGQPLAYSWVLSKAVLLVLALIAGLAVRASLGRPASPRRLRAVVRLALGALPLVIAYVAIGAAWQMNQARQAASQNPVQARGIYRRAFEGYRMVPVAYLFGADFARYIGYPVSPGLHDMASGPARDAALARLLDLTQRHPEGAWADDALYEVIRLAELSAPSTEDERVARRVSVQHCRTFLERYPGSCYAPEVARRMVMLANATGDTASMQWAYERAATAYRGTDGASEAAAAMQQYYLASGDVARAGEAAQASADLAPDKSRAQALLRLGAFYAEHGDLTRARAAYAQVEAAARAKLVAEGLDTISVGSTSADDLAQRRAILQMRDQARAALAACDAGRMPPPPAAPVPPPPRHGRHRNGQ